MAVWHGKDLRKPSGGKKRKNAKKKSYLLGKEYVPIHKGPEKRIKVRVMGGGEKVRLYREEHINTLDPKTKEIKKTKIESVLENAANPHYARRQIITKGAILQTELGKVKVTSRPGQTGTLNGVLLKE